MNSRRTGRLVAVTAAIAAVVVAGAAGTYALAEAKQRPPVAGLRECTPPAPPPSTPPSARPSNPAPPSSSAPPTGGDPQPEPPAPTTVETVEEVYNCLLTYYVNSPRLDNKKLLTVLLAVTVEELNRRGRDAPNATMPALSGDKVADWNAFKQVYTALLTTLPDDATRRSVTEFAIAEMVKSLGDNHTHWESFSAATPPNLGPGQFLDLGLDVDVTPAQLDYSAGTAVGPLFVSHIRGGPAKAAGLKAGDVINSINGSRPFIDGHPTAHAITKLYPTYPDLEPVTLQLTRPSTGRNWTATITPAIYTPDPGTLELVNPKLLKGGVAYVWLRMFARGAADKTIAAIQKLKADNGNTLRGVVLDLRGNHGGAQSEVDRLLAAFAHGKVTGYQCTLAGDCLEEHTADSVALLNLPLTVLTDRGCASACDAFAAAVKDHKVGPIIGTRSAGQVSGEGAPFWLTNHTMLVMPIRYHLGPNREYISGVGVAPDHYIPLTAQDVSSGHDPAVTKALQLLGR